MDNDVQITRLNPDWARINIDMQIIRSTYIKTVNCTQKAFNNVDYL